MWAYSITRGHCDAPQDPAAAVPARCRPRDAASATLAGGGSNVTHMRARPTGAPRGGEGGVSNLLARSAQQAGPEESAVPSKEHAAPGPTELCTGCGCFLPSSGRGRSR